LGKTTSIANSLQPAFTQRRHFSVLRQNRLLSGIWPLQQWEWKYPERFFLNNGQLKESLRVIRQSFTDSMKGYYLPG